MVPEQRQRRADLEKTLVAACQALEHCVARRRGRDDQFNRNLERDAMMRVDGLLEQLFPYLDQPADVPQTMPAQVWTA